MANDLAPDLMLKGLEDGLRSRLKERILEKITPDIDAMVTEAMESLKVTLETYKEPHNMRQVIHVILEDRRQTSA